MAEFIYKDYECSLKFGDNTFNLALNEQTAQQIEDIFNSIKITPDFQGIEDIDRFYNELMDGIDTLLGDGAAENIMSRYAHPGTMEILSVIQFIVKEFDREYAAAVEEMKKTTPANRAQRRAGRR